jgi:VWFA-related protein
MQRVGLLCGIGVFACALLVLAIFLQLLSAGVPIPAQDSSPTFQSKSHEVILDLIVRNKHGETVRDLKRSDVQIYEDGRPQEITSLRMIDGGQQQSDSARGLFGNEKPSVLGSNIETRLVSLVFDRLTGAEQHSARLAINDLLSSAIPRSTYIAVFVLDRSLYLLQAFTNDPELVRNAAIRATSGLPSQYVHDSEQNLIRLEELYLKNDVIGLDPMDAVMIRTLRDQVRNERYQQGRVQLDALLSLVRYQHLLPGRKAIVYFSQGLVVPSETREPFENLIGAANHARVSFYAVDVRGLEGIPTAAPANSLINNLEAGGVSRAEWQPETLRSDANSTRMALDELAVKTGGFLSATNDIREPLRRVWDDLHTYYEATYRPTWSEYDGQFHKITVHLLRRGLTVQSRDGYYALPDFGGRTLLPYESELLRALSWRPLPASLTARSAVTCYRAGKTDRCVLTFSVPLSKLKSTHSNTLAGTRQLAFLALIRNARNEVVDVLSRNLMVEAPAESEADKNKGKMPLGNFTRIERLDLAPGRYTAEIAIQDRQSLALSAKRISLYVPEFQDLAVSEVIRVRSLSSIQGMRDETDPLEFDSDRVTPDLSDTFKQQPGASAALYLIVYPAAASTARIEMAAKIVGEHGPVIQAVPAVFAASRHKANAVSYVLSIPVEHLEPGDYIFEATIRQAEKSIQRLYAFKVVGN